MTCAGYLCTCGRSCYSARNKSDDDDKDYAEPGASALLRAGLSPETQWAFLQLGLPGGCMMAADASSFDLTTAMAGALGADRPYLHESPACAGTSLLPGCRHSAVTQNAEFLQDVEILH